MANRSQLAQLARETLDILRSGKYTSPNGVQVSITAALNDTRNHSVHYTPQSFTDVFRHRDQFLATAPRFPTVFEVVNETTLAAARRLGTLHPTENVLCLNFASAKHPGGGFLKGARAQEESLARSSGLYPCLTRFQEMYETNKRFGSCLYTHHMIYSPKVPVIRDDAGTLLEEPYLVSFLTSPAVNTGAVQNHEKPKIDSTMLERMERILSLAVVHEHRVLVLGAWGCGVFKNHPAKVARGFHRFLVEDERFKGAFKTVAFAVTDRSEEQRFIGPFREQFARAPAVPPVVQGE